MQSVLRQNAIRTSGYKKPVAVYVVKNENPPRGPAERGNP